MTLTPQSGMFDLRQFEDGISSATILDVFNGNLNLCATVQTSMLDLHFKSFLFKFAVYEIFQKNADHFSNLNRIVHHLFFLRKQKFQQHDLSTKIHESHLSCHHVG